MQGNSKENRYVSEIMHSKHQPNEQVNAKTDSKDKRPDILIWIGEFRPGNKTIWVMFDVDSDVLRPRM